MKKSKHNHMKHLFDSDKSGLKNLNAADKRVEKALQESNKRVFKKTASMKIDW